MRTTPITREMIASWFGTPDLFGRSLYLYRFDHKRAGRDRDEQYFCFDDEKLVNSGFNVRDVNDHSDLSPGSAFGSTDG